MIGKPASTMYIVKVLIQKNFASYTCILLFDKLYSGVSSFHHTEHYKVFKLRALYSLESSSLKSIKNKS